MNNQPCRRPASIPNPDSLGKQKFSEFAEIGDSTGREINPDHVCVDGFEDVEAEFG